MLYATDFGALFDGATDDSAAIQSAIDAANMQGEPLMLPGRTALIDTELDLRGRDVEIYGTMNKTRLTAGTTGMTMINVEETSDRILSPFKLQGIILDGASRAAFGLRIRYRHGSELNGLLVEYATTANVWERDTWLSRRYNCRVFGGAVGWQLEGSNFASSFLGCYIAGCTDAHWLLNNNGTQVDGNDALLFSACGATDGAGRGIVANGLVKANFSSCYIGENLADATLVNNGATLVFEGGNLSFGSGTLSFLCLPIGGQTILTAGAKITGQAYGSIDRITSISAAQVAAGAGTLRLDDVDGYMTTGGNPVTAGDVLGYGEQRNVLVPRLGREFQPIGYSTTIATSNPSPNSQQVTCTGITGGNPIIGFSAPINPDYRVNEAAYLVLVYRSSKSLQVRIDAGVLGAPLAYLSFPPATSVLATHVKLDNPLPGVTGGAVLDIFMPGAAVDDVVEVSECFLTDSTMAAKGPATVSRLFKC